MIPRSALLRQRAVLIRTAGQFNQFGEWIKAQPVEREVICTSAPDTGAERILDSTGERREGLRYFWLGPEIDISIGGSDHTADLVRYAGDLFRVIELERYPRSHIRATGERVVPNV